ncbi:SMP-30/gluconolactonase/LRE family protein [Georgenia sp. MJ170]|uniref:SMP-30/gluconolactonase/LRE family protein n=1 Tax=Georgenia sunbinii TaxID=3117728 RepID=UPI002F26BD7B
MTAPLPTQIRPTVLDVPACALGESPRWAHDAWWWVDAEAGVVWTAPASVVAGAVDGVAGTGPGAREVLRSGDRLSLVHPATEGALVVARGTELLVVDPATSRTRPWARIDVPPGWLLNDGIADAAGRLWIGSVHPGRAPGTGRLHVVHLDGTVAQVADGLTLSNGMAWRSPSRLLHADSLERCVWEYEVDPASATVLHTERALQLPDEPMGGPALPDGLAIDRGGGLWVAMYGTGEVRRWSHGRVSEVIVVPTAQVTSVALGGPDGRDLLITTAQEGLSDDELLAAPWAGRVFGARATIPGVSVPAAAPRA